MVRSWLSCSSIASVIIAVISCLFRVRSFSGFSFCSLVREILTILCKSLRRVYLGTLLRSIQACPMSWTTLMQNSSLNLRSIRVIFSLYKAISTFLRYSNSYSGTHWIGFVGYLYSFSSFSGRTIGFGKSSSTAKKGWFFTCPQSNLFKSDFWSMPSISSRRGVDISRGNLTG